MKYYTTLCILLLSMVSCGGKKTLFDETQNIAGTWNRFENKTFTVPVTNTDDYFDIYMKVAVDTTLFRQSSLPLNVNIYSPDGERRMFRASVPLRDRQGLPAGTVEHGRMVVDRKVRDLFSFNSKGDYRIEVGQATHLYDIKGVKQITLHIEKAELALPE